jgi:tetratricopeptide (TPR) repeat protein
MKVVRAVLILLLVCSAMAQQTAPASQKVIKDPAEYNAYITALNTENPAQKAAAMENFVRVYPNSVVKVDAMEQAMAAYQQSGNQPKVEETAGRILDLNPQNVRALAILTFIARYQAAQGNADATARLKGLSERGIQALPQWQKPEGMSDADFSKLKNQMGEIFYGTGGFAALQQKDYASARSAYLKAVEMDPANMQDVYQLGVAELEMNPLDPNGFWYIAKAVNLAQGNPQAQQAIKTYGSGKYRRYHGTNDGWDQIVAQASSQTAPPANFASSISVAPSPAELAVKVVRENDPGTLSFSDWEYILSFRDASPANKQAADRVWQAIREKERNGQAKLKLPIKVISATKTTIHAAITDENQQANTPDLEVTLEKPVLHPPAPGAKVDVVGILADYRPSPFAFIMNEAELAPAAPRHH